MSMHLREPVVRAMDQVGAVCAYVIILSMLAFAMAPLFAPLLQR
jgi:hypothetical protein